MSEAMITYKGVVYPRECDHMGHLNVAYYMDKFDQATWNLLDEIGLTRAYREANGINMAAVDQHITYQRELMPGDTVVVRSELLELAGKKIKFRHVMYEGAGGEVSSTIEQLALCIDRPSRKSRPFPDDIVARGRALIGSAAA